MKIAVRNLFKMVNEIISISNRPVKQVTMDASNTTQSNTQYTAIKIINTVHFCLVKFHIKSYITADRQLYHIISMNPIFFNCQNEPRFFPDYCSKKNLN